MKHYLAIIFLLANISILKGQVVINEAMPNNKGIILDEDNESSDWIELYNTSPNSVNLNGWSLSDEGEADEWIFPDVNIQANGFLLVFLSGKNRNASPLHASFSYSSKEAITLFNGNKSVASSISPYCVPDSVSYGLLNPTSNNYGFFKTPTPASVNNESDTITVRPVLDTVYFSHTSGFYGEPIELKLNSNFNSKIYFTLNGEEPGESSFTYAGPISIIDKSPEDDFYSLIETSPEWTKPDGPSAKASVVRAVVYSQGCPVTDIITNTYFIGNDKKGRYHFPVVSLASDRSSFFGNKKGIYVEGNGEVANYLQTGSEWERDISFEYFINDQRVLNHNSQARIHGRFSRNQPQKSLRIYSGNTSFNYPFFSQKAISDYRRIILKTVDSHSTTTMFKDEVSAMLMRNMNMDIMAWQPTIVFINGEYWGIHNMREREDRYYLANNHQANIDSLNIQGISLDGEEDIEGTREDYDKLIAMLENNDISDPSIYQKVEDEIDMDNYIDYHIAQLYFANYDWPRNNVRFWKEGKNGKWRWLFFDCDVCFINDEYDMLIDYVRGQERFDDYTFLLRTLLKNEQFRDRFFSRFMYVINNYLLPEKVIPLIDSCEAIYSPMVNEHIKRWHVPLSYNDWHDNIQIMKDFAKNRPLQMMDQLNTYLPSPYSLFPNPTNDGFYIVDGSKQNSTIHVELFNTSGKLVKSFNSTELSAGLTGKLNIQDLPAGLYLCRFLVNSQYFFSKLVVN